MPLLVAASPTPAPSLASVLASPASPDYVDDNDPAIPLQGDFSIGDYMAWLNAPDAQSAASKLQHLGFVAGHGHVWMQETSSHLLLEAVVAFSGASGARQWLHESESIDKQDSAYDHPISVGGLASYYAWHGAVPSAPEYADVVAFVKGNDFFIVIADSTADDLGDTASLQSKQQYAAAPSFTIPPSQWPENSRRRSLNYYFAVALPNLILLDVMALFALGAAAAVWLWRRRSNQVLISPDGYYWWDGHAWRPVSRPPS